MVYDLGFMVYDLGFRVQGLWSLRVQGIGYRV